MYVPAACFSSCFKHRKNDKYRRQRDIINQLAIVGLFSCRRCNHCTKDELQLDTEFVIQLWQTFSFRMFVLAYINLLSWEFILEAFYFDYSPIYLSIFHFILNIISGKNTRNLSSNYNCNYLKKGNNDFMSYRWKFDAKYISECSFQLGKLGILSRWILKFFGLFRIH